MDSFNYVISSDDRLNDVGQLTNFYEIDFGGFNTSYDNFNVEIIQVVLNGNVLSSNGYLIMVAQDLNDGQSVFCPGILNSNESILGVISANIDGLISNSSINLRTNDVRMHKNIVFSLRNPDFSLCVSGTDINLGGIETRWVITMKLSPIKDGC